MIAAISYGRRVAAGALAAALAATAPTPLASSSAAPIDAVAIAGGAESSYRRILGPRLRDVLFPNFEIELKAEENQRIALQAVADDRSTMAFSQRDVFARFLRETPRLASAMEFYGRMPACLYFVIRKSGPIERYGDLADRQLDATLDVGPATGETASSFAALVEAEPGLGRIRLEHRGGVRALSRVAGGQIDGALIVAAPGVRDGLLDLAVGNDALWVMPVGERDVFRGRPIAGFPFSFRRVPVGAAGWFGWGPEVQTICTEVGVVVNTAANPRLIEATAAAILNDRLTGTASSFGPTVETVVRWVSDTAKATFDLAVATAAWVFERTLSIVDWAWEARPWARGASVAPAQPPATPVRPARIAL